MKFCDLNRQYDLYKEEIRAAMDEVLESAAFINGPAVDALAEELSAYTGVKHSFPCASGTDALLLALMALEVKPGDEVLGSSLHLHRHRQYGGPLGRCSRFC
jgi:UDP-2-acetamido-2-deoxy-ribo-hexuluronate aminotransferase